MNTKRWQLALKNNWLLILGAVLAIVFVYSDFFLGDYQISFTNMMYTTSPWIQEGVATDGPVLSDVIDSFYPEMYSTLTDGTFFGFWNPNVALGTTSDVSSWLYPLNYWYLLPLTIATLLRTLSEFLLAFLGMYLLMKAFGCKKSVSAITGVCYCFSSIMVLWLGWQHSDVTALAPFAFFFFEKFLSTVQIRYCFGIAASVYLMLVAGMPTYAGYFLYLLTIYVICRTVWMYRKTPKLIWVIFAGTLAAVLLGAICSLPYTMNLLTSLGGNGYMDSRSHQASLTLSLDYLLSMFFPYIRLESGDFHINESTLYVGLLPLITFFFTPYRFREKKRMIFWCGALVILFVLIFTHGLDFIFARLPMINSSPKMRIIVLFNFAAVIIAGLNLNDLFSHREEYQKHKISTILLLLAGTALLVGVWAYTNSQVSGQGYDDQLISYLVVTVLMAILLAALLIPKIPTRVLAVLLCAVTVYNMGMFAKEYFPLVDKQEGDIPQATETISYLQQNTTDERMAAAGDWTMFANTNVLYGLSDVRGHNFVFTNQDMATYYQAMDPNSRSTATRYCLTAQANPNLLKYLGVKYFVIGDLQFGKPSTAATPIYGELSLSQEHVFDTDQPTGMVLISATYGQEYAADERCYLTITETQTGTPVYSAEYSLAQFRDNSPCFLSLEGNELKAGVEYTLTLTANTTETHPITFWSETQNPYPAWQEIYNGEEIPSDLFLLEISSMYGTPERVSMSDGLVPLELDEYSQRVELADQVVVLEEEEDVLQAMSREFVSNTAFLTQEQADQLTHEEMGPLTDSDFAEITDRTDDTVTVEVHTQTPKLLMLNDYYNDDWKVYVNGEEQSVVKSNYLFRSVEVPAGDSVVEFRYEPKLLYGMFVVAGVGLLSILVLILLHRRIQRKIDRLAAKYPPLP